jgi:3-mercaptopyruvate sulfurtransferase SseA
MPISRPRTTLLALTTAAVLLAACSGQAAAPSPTAAPAAAPSPTAYSEDLPEVPRVSLEDAKAAYLDHTAVFVDVRSTGEYEYRHIPGSINIYFGDLEQHLSELDKEKWIITYCG